MDNIIVNMINGWPLILFVGLVSIITTILLKGVQFRSLYKAFQLVFTTNNNANIQSSDMSPLQAFINTLSTNLGNGSIAGTATAIAVGGPGAAVWIVIIGFITMSVRFVEVYMSAVYGSKNPKAKLGGPMLYLQDLPGGCGLSLVYGFLCFLFALVGGNSVQANSISVGLQTVSGLPAMVIAIGLGCFVLYVMYGGAKRIVMVSDYVVPIKVGLFFGSALFVLMMHYKKLIPALILMFRASFDATAVLGGIAGLTLQHTIRMGMQRSIFATESGLGTAAVLFGATGAQDPFTSGLLGMMSTFVSSLVCFLVGLCIVVTNVWSSGLTSTALTIAAYQTAFGSFGGAIVTFLAIIFGLGVIVSYGYIVRACWAYISGNSYELVPVVMYCAASFFGALGAVEFVWTVTDIVMACMLCINLYAILYYAYRYRAVITQKLAS